MTDSGRLRTGTIPDAVRKRPWLAFGVALFGLIAGVLWSTRGGDFYQATATFVVDTPQSDNSSGAQLAVISPDRFVNDQVALFDLGTLLNSAAAIANEQLDSLARRASTGSVTVNEGDPIVLGRNGSIRLRDRDETVFLDADGTLALQGAGVARIGAGGELLRPDGSAVLDIDGTPVAADGSDTVVVREDGLVVLARTAASTLVIAPDGALVDVASLSASTRSPGSAATDPNPVAGLNRTAGGTLLVAFGPNTLRIEPALRPVVIDEGGAVLTRPASSELVGVSESRLLLRTDGAFVARSTADTATFDVDPARSALFDLRATVIQRSANVVIGTPSGPEPEPVVPLDAAQVRDGLSVRARPNSNVVQVRFTADRADRAVIIANATVDAYQTLRSTGAGTERGAAQARAEQAIDAVSAQLVEVESQLTALTLSNPDRQALEAQYAEILSELVAAGRQLIDNPNQGPVAAQRVRDLVSQIDAIEQVGRVGLTQSGVADLTSRRAQLRDRLGQLQGQLDALSINASGGTDPVALFSPAVEADPVQGLGVTQLGFVGFVLAALAGAGLAYALELRHPTVDTAEQVGDILGVPLLSEVPDFKHERIRGQLPVLKSPSSYSAEAIRMAAVTLSLRLADRQSCVIGVVSGGVGDGKTTIATNLAMALAQANRRVLAIDADLEGQVMSHLMRRQANWSTQWRGMIDVIESSAALQDATRLVKLDDGPDLELLTSGTGAWRLRTMLDTPETARLFEAAAESYDIVVVDLPPLLNVAYAAHLLRLMHGVVVVAAAGSGAEGLEEVAERLELLDVSVLGFVFNRAPLRIERTASVSALHYDLGRRPLNRRRWAKRHLRSQRLAEKQRGEARRGGTDDGGRRGSAPGRDRNRSRVIEPAEPAGKDQAGG